MRLSACLFGRLAAPLSAILPALMTSCSGQPSSAAASPAGPALPEAGVPAPPPASSAAASVAPPSPIPEVAVAPFVVAPTPRADWVETEPGSAECSASGCADATDRWKDRGLLAVGKRAAAITTDLGVFVSTLDRGIVGPIALREPTPASPPAVGFGAGDSVFHAAASGQVYWASSPEQAVQSLEARGKVAGASKWDFVPGLVVAVANGELWVSTDDARTFTRSVPSKGKDVSAAVARPDGVIVADDSEGMHVSRDRGRTWKPSRVEGGGFERRGSWISICGATLSSDGVHWTDQEPPVRDDDAWLAPFVLASTPRGVALPRMFTISDPPPPAPPAGDREVQGGVGCSGPMSPPRPGRGVGGVGGIGRAGEFKPYGLKRIANDPFGDGPPATRTQLVFASDGSCAASAADPDSYECREGARLQRQPHMLAVDRVTGRAAMGAVPRGCKPAELFDAMGVGLLACRAATSAHTLELVDRAAATHHETDLRFQSIGDFTQAPDGTLMIPTSAKGEPPTVAVRAPSPLGTATAWRVVRIPSALALRIGPGGAVVGVTAAQVDADRFALVLDQPGRGTQEIARAIPVEGGLADFEVRADGIVLVTRHTVKGETIRARLGVDGSLQTETGK